MSDDNGISSVAIRKIRSLQCLDKLGGWSKIVSVNKLVEKHYKITSDSGVFTRLLQHGYVQRFTSHSGNGRTYLLTDKGKKFLDSDYVKKCEAMMLPASEEFNINEADRKLANDIADMERAKAKAKAIADMERAKAKAKVEADRKLANDIADRKLAKTKTGPTKRTKLAQKQLDSPVCKTLNQHHDEMKDDPDSLSTEFIQEIIGVDCGPKTMSTKYKRH